VAARGRQTGGVVSGSTRSSGRPQVGGSLGRPPPFSTGRRGTSPPTPVVPGRPSVGCCSTPASWRAV